MAESSSGPSEITIKWADAIGSASLDGLSQAVERGIENKTLSAAIIVPEYKAVARIGGVFLSGTLGAISANESPNAAISLSATAGGVAAQVLVASLIESAGAGIATTAAAGVISVLVPIGIGFVVEKLLTAAYQAEYDAVGNLTQQLIANPPAFTVALSNLSSSTLTYVEQEVNSVIANVASLNAAETNYESQVSNYINQTISNVATDMASSFSSFLTSVGASASTLPAIDLSGVDPWITSAAAALSAESPTTAASSVQDLYAYIAANASGAPVDFASALQAAAAINASKDPPLANGLSFTPLANGGFSLVASAGDATDAKIDNTYNDLGQIVSQTADEADGTSQITVYNSDGSSTETSYSGIDGVGNVEGQDIQNTNGTSQITIDGSLGESVTLDFTGTNGADTVTEYNNSSIISSSVPYDPNFDLIAGDSIDIANSGTVSAVMLNSDDVVVLSEFGGGITTLNLDPTQSFISDAFLFASDGSGGTVITAADGSEPVIFGPTKPELMLIPDLSAFSGTISNFVIGDTITLNGVTATSAALGPNNVLTVGESGGSVAVQLDPTQSYASDNLLLNATGSATNITVVAGGVFNFSGPNQILVVTNAASLEQINGYQLGDIIDLAGIPLAEVTQSLNNANALTITGSSGSSYDLTIEPAVSNSITSSIQSDGQGGTEIIPAATRLETYTYTGQAFTGIPTTGYPLGTTFLAGNIVAQLTFEIPQNFTTTGSNHSGYSVYSEFNPPSALLTPELVSFSITAGGQTFLTPATTPQIIQENYGFDVDWLNGQISGTISLSNRSADDGYPFSRIQTASTGDLASLEEGSSFEAGLNMVPGVWTSNAVACFLAGTRILTVHGERQVETLVIGDMVRAFGAGHTPIKWIGRRSYAGRFLAGNPNVQPVCFRRGSLGNGLPRRDLYVSPEHAMFLEGFLIPARHLVNGTTITKVCDLESVDYFHIELETHDVILAEGAASETYIDDDSRGMFANASDFAARYPDAVSDRCFCALRIEHGYELEAIRRRLNGAADQQRLAA